MGGQGSGRPPSVGTLIARSQPVLTPIGDSIFLPNYSGIQQAALKSSAPLGTGGGGHVIQEEGTSLTQRTNLNFSGSGVTAYDDAANDATIVSVNTGGAETDPYFFNLSGSLPYIPTTDYPDFELSGSPTFLSLSGGIAVGGDVTGTVSSIQVDHVNIASIGTNTHAAIDSHIADATIHYISGSLWQNINSLSGGLSSLSGSFATLSGAYYAHAADTSDPHGATLTQTNINSSGTIYSTNRVSGANAVFSGTLSGANIVNTADHNTSGSAYCLGIIMDTSSVPPTASNFPYGTIYIQYTP